MRMRAYVVQITETTDPQLERDDVETSLRAAGNVSAEVRCDGRRFVALGVCASAS